MIQSPRNLLIAFDLDDTLYKEADYVDSVFRIIAAGNERLYEQMQSIGKPYEAFELLEPPSCSEAIEYYRSGKAPLADTEGAKALLTELCKRGIIIAVVTDGWSRRQRGKLVALGIENLIDTVLVSEEIGTEKTSGEAFKLLETLYPDKKYVYVGDNPAKDFEAANSRGWITVMIVGDTRNIHPQSLENLASEKHPAIIVESLAMVADLIF